MGVLDDIIASLQVEHPAPVAPVGVMPAPEVTPSMTYAVPGAGAQPVLAPADPTANLQAAAAGPTSLGGAPLAGTSRQWATTPPAEDIHSWFNGGLGPSAQASPPGARLYSYAKGKDKPDDWVPAAPTMVAPPVTPLGAIATVPRPRAPVLGGVLGR